jgi:hypothetical protein
MCERPPPKCGEALIWAAVPSVLVGARTGDCGFVESVGLALVVGDIIV